MLKCAKFDSSLGSVSDPAAGAYSAPPHSVAGFKGFTSKEMGWRGRKGKEWKGM